MKFYHVCMIVLLSLILVTCSDSGSTFPNTPHSGGGPGNVTEEWLIPKDQVLDGGPGKDGIPAINNPVFATVNDDQGKLDWMDDNDLILAIKVGDEIRGYPHPVLDWHEIVNDEIGDTSVAITYCPLTGTGIGWGRLIAGKKSTFGVSGLLYNSNLMPYDRATESYWSQMRQDCVHGNQIGTTAKLYQLVEIPWKLWREWFPDAKVVVGGSSVFSRPYDRYPYGNYRTEEGTIFPTDREDDNRLPGKERVLGVIRVGQAIVFRLSAFGLQPTSVRKKEFFGGEIVVFGSERDNFMVAYYSELEDGTSLSNFKAVQNKQEIVAMDSEGNEWNIFGEAVSGPRTGQRLQPTNSLMGYWFTWPAFYEFTEIHGF